MKTRSWLITLSALLAILLLIAPAGCTTTDEAIEARSRAVAARDTLIAQTSDLEFRLANLPANDPARPDLESQLARSRTAAAKLSQGISLIDATLASTPPSPEGELVDALDDLLPPVWRAPLLLGGVGLGLFLRSRQLRQGITTIAQGIEIAKREDPAFLEAFQRHANTFRSIQSPTARRVVDEITGTARPAGVPGSTSKVAPAAAVIRKSPTTKTSTKAPTSYSQP